MGHELMPKRLRTATEQQQENERVERTTQKAFLDEAIGRRYHACSLANFEVEGCPKRAKAVSQVEKYIEDFPENFQTGTSLVFIGPKGTGKDHLMVAACRAILARGPRLRVTYRDGLTLFAEFRAAFSAKNPADEDSIVDKYGSPHLLAISDPLPPTGQLSEYEQRMILRIIDRRYRECRPVAATCNVATRGELDKRLGPQAADRLCDDAVVVVCDWESYRSRKEV